MGVKRKGIKGKLFHMNLVGKGFTKMKICIKTEIHGSVIGELIDEPSQGNIMAMDGNFHIFHFLFYILSFVILNDRLSCH